MNLLYATVELSADEAELQNALGGEYLVRNATIPGGGEDNSVKLKVFCHPGNKPRAERFKTQSKAFVTGMLIFTEDLSKPIGLVVDQVEKDPGFRVNQCVLGNAYFTKKEPTTKASGTTSVRIGTTLDNGNDSLYLFMEVDQSRYDKLMERYRSGRSLTVVGSIREYHGGKRDENDQPYRAIVATNFSTRAEQPKGGGGGRPVVDPLPDCNAY
jgi:hypothetical protein